MLSWESLLRTGTPNPLPQANSREKRYKLVHALYLGLAKQVDSLETVHNEEKLGHLSEPTPWGEPISKSDLQFVT